MACSALGYVLAFALYAALLRSMPISIASPVTMVGGMVLVVAAGSVMGERVSVQRLCGLALGIAAVVVLLTDKE